MRHFIFLVSAAIVSAQAYSDVPLIYLSDESVIQNKYLETHEGGMILERRGAALVVVETPHVLAYSRPTGEGEVVYKEVVEEETWVPVEDELEMPDVQLPVADSKKPRDDTESILAMRKAQENLELQKNRYRKTDPVSDLLNAGTQGYKVLKDGTRIPVTYVDPEWDEYKGLSWEEERYPSSKMEAGALNE